MKTCNLSLDHVTGSSSDKNHIGQLITSGIQSFHERGWTVEHAVHYSSAPTFMPEMAHLKSLIGRKSGASPVSCDMESLRLRLGYDIDSMHASGYDPSIIEEHQAFNDKLNEILVHPLIGKYLAGLTPEEIYCASHVRVLPLGAIKDEITQLAPGVILFRYSYLPFATSIGGHALCFHAPTSEVVWADHESFSCEDSITYKDRRTGKWHTVAFAPENIKLAIVPLAADIRVFLNDLLHDRLETRLDELDLGRPV